MAAWATLEAAVHFKGKVEVASDAFGLIKNRTIVEQVERGVHSFSSWLGALK